MSCVICYKGRCNSKNALLCSTGNHHTCYDCLERGDLIVISESGWPCYKIKCPVCRLWTFQSTERVDDLHLARALIKKYQECMREESDDD